MCRSHKIVLVLLTGVLLLICSPAVSRMQEPSADGKPITVWIYQLRIGVKVMHGPGGNIDVMLPNLTDRELASLTVSTNVRTFGQGWAFTTECPPWPDRYSLWRFDELRADPAAKAIQRIGPAALPYLRAGLHCRESRVQELFWRWVGPHFPARLLRLTGTPIHPRHRRANSAYALGLLGESASPLVAELRVLSENDPDYLVRSVACEAIQRIIPATAGPFHPELFPSKQRVRDQLPPDDHPSDVFGTKLAL